MKIIEITDKIPKTAAKIPRTRAMFLNTFNTFLGVFSVKEKAEIFSEKSFTVNLEPQ